MPNLRLYNSLTRKKEDFHPIDPKNVRLYACGPTVYNYAHIGNARMAVIFDVLARLLKQQYPKVTYASNITDVEDKIIEAAREAGEEISVITQKYTDIYNADMEGLGCMPPDIQPKATEHIDEMIALIEALIERGHAYEKEGHVLFHVPSFKAYGGLSGRSRDDQIAGSRVEVAPFKKDPADFVLWKPSSADQPGWESPFGPPPGLGRPGWHIECSAMAEKHLGLPFDIHGGGADLKFPHHENEIAQSCCAHGIEDDLSAFAKLWVHNGFLSVEGEKMSKSLGNVVLVHDLLEEKGLDYGPVIRLALLSAHYRKPLDWSARALEQAEKLYVKILKVVASFDDMKADVKGAVDAGILEALLDDLNTPLAFTRLNELLTQCQKNDDPSLKLILQHSLQVLGIDVSEEALQRGKGEDQNAAEISAAYKALLEERQQARAEKNFARADEIRDQLAADGFEIKDTPEGAKLVKI